MLGAPDWEWKLREAAERIRAHYDHIGRATGAPFLAIVYPPDAERGVLKEWRMLSRTLEPDFSVRPVDVLEVTSSVVRRFGVETLVASMTESMPGGDPIADLGRMWADGIAARVHEVATTPGPGRPVVALERLAALYPAAGPKAVMDALWHGDRSVVEGPVVFLIPGVLVQARVYRFVDQGEELMYRGDIL